MRREGRIQGYNKKETIGILTSIAIRSYRYFCELREYRYVLTSLAKANVKKPRTSGTLY